MKVVVVTRFAIDVYSDAGLTLFGDANRNLRFLDSAWVAARWNLFEQFALRSVQLQTRRPDLWLVVVDSRAPIALRKMRSALPSFARLVVLESGEQLSSAVSQALLSCGEDVLTVRLDSDDMISPDFLQMAERKVRPNQGINFPHGLQFFVNRSVLAHRWIKSNPTVGFRSVRCSMNVHSFGGHSNLARCVKVREVRTIRPMFLKGSHNENHVYFQPSGWPVLFPERAQKLFSLSMPVSSLWRVKVNLLISYCGFLLNKRWPRFTHELEKFRSRTGATPPKFYS